MKKTDKDPTAYAHHHLEDEAKALEKLQKKQEKCKHHFIDPITKLHLKHCFKCGMTP